MLGLVTEGPPVTLRQEMQNFWLSASTDQLIDAFDNFGDIIAPSCDRFRKYLTVLDVTLPTGQLQGSKHD